MTDDEALQEYRRHVRRLKEECNRAGISDEEFRKMYFDNLKDLTKIDTRSYKSILIKTISILIVSCVIAVIAINNFTSLYSCIICSLQEYIYPGLRILRKLAIPLISLFPSLTGILLCSIDLYQETCLVQNPFFTVVDMDCWPCSMVNNIGEVYDPRPVTKQHNAPFIYKTEQSEINIDILQKLYTDNANTFQKENSKVFVDNQYYLPLSSIINNGDNLYVWKINSINEARIVRKIITRPKVVPKFGQSIERFIIIDSKHSSFQIPDTECNYSFLLAVSGTRMIDLRPAEECKHQCRSLKIELKESYLLWYNWWYWRPYVNKLSSNKTFIAHVGSYC